MFHFGLDQSCVVPFQPDLFRPRKHTSCSTASFGAEGHMCGRPLNKIILILGLQMTTTTTIIINIKHIFFFYFFFSFLLIDQQTVGSTQNILQIRITTKKPIIIITTTTKSNKNLSKEKKRKRKNGENTCKIFAITHKEEKIKTTMSNLYHHIFIT